MAEPYFSDSDKDSFLEAVESLKKYRRADLIDEKGSSILDTLYTDLLPHDHILKKCMRENTTFLIGRKGTGKSTIFLKLERELKKKKGYLSCYIDVNTVYESSQTQSFNLNYLSDHLSSEALERYLIERTFVQNVLKEIIEEIRNTSSSFFGKLARKLRVNRLDEVNKKLEQLKNQIENNQSLKKIELPIFQSMKIKKKDTNENNKERTIKIGKMEAHSKDTPTSHEKGIKTDSGFELAKKNKVVSENENEFSEVLLKVFQIKDIISKIQDILKIINIKHLYILLDDLSEIGDEPIKTFVDTIIAPLNNWSEEFIKFKIAVYPNRIHYGKIDPGKVDTINLDFYDLYSEFDRNKMEENAINFTNRLIEKRIDYYTKKTPEHFFDISKNEINEYYELLFQSSMNVPRIMGYILSYCHQNKIIYDKPITKLDIEAAAQKYYLDKIKPFFFTTTYSLLALDEKITNLQLEELLKLFVDRLNEIKKRITTKVLKGSTYLHNQPFSTHFHFDSRLEKFIRTLELNYFISKYAEQSDKDGNQSSIYCINYGLAGDNNLLWGKPKGTAFRKYFIERPFNFTKNIEVFLTNSKKIYCTNSACNKLFNFSELPHIEYNHYKCNDCGHEIKVEAISESLIKEINEIDKDKLLPREDMKILVELSKSNQFKLARDIAEELDFHAKYVASRGKILDERYRLIEREMDSKPYGYRLTDKARKMYFDKIKL